VASFSHNPPLAVKRNNLPGTLSIHGEIRQKKHLYKKFLGIQNPFYKKGFGRRGRKLTVKPGFSS